MNKLNIGIVCYPSYGGSGVVATELGLGLAKKGHSVHFISYETPFRLYGFDENIQFHEVDMQSYPLFKYPLYSLSLTSKIIEVCEANELDVLHVHYAIPHSICAFLAQQMLRKHNVKVVTTLHGTDITLVGQEQSYYRLVQFGIEESDEVTSVSQDLRDVTLREFKIDRKIHVIPNFVDPNKFTPEVKQPKCLFVKGKEKVVMHISNFRPVKNIETVIQTFYRIQKRVDSCLVLIGDGPDIPAARQLAMKLGIIEKVSFRGRIEQVECILPCADLFLLPSELESFGLSLLEAMSCGVPTISSNAGGIPGVVVEGETGYMFEPHDFKGMSEKAVEILENPELHGTLSKNGRKRAESVFHIDKIVSQYEQLYYATVL